MIEGHHIVADAANACTFVLKSEPWPDIQAKLAPFGISPASVEELMEISVKKRPDLLIGKVEENVLRFQAMELSLEPVCSTVIHRIVQTHGLDGCWRRRFDDPVGDIIQTPRAEITGALPIYVYHGTCESRLKAIRRDGLRIDRPREWSKGGQGHVYLAAEAQVSAFHARRTATKHDCQPIVLRLRLPDPWAIDHDVDHQMVQSADVPGTDGVFFSQEAGLFASPAVIPPSDILEVRRPVHGTRYATWPIV